MVIDTLGETSKDKGNALESVVESIFQTAGFNTKKNARLMGYEIDVLAELNDTLRFVVECKNYQKSKLTIRNLIHQWESKNKVIKAQKVILVLVGLNIKSSDRALASKLNIELWGESDLHEYQKLQIKPNELRHSILSNVKLELPKISNLFGDHIDREILRDILSGNYYDEDFDVHYEEIYERFGEWIRTYILINLWLDEPTKKERKKLIKIFESARTKTVRYWFFFTKEVSLTKRENWEELMRIFGKEEELSKDMRKRYLEAMKEIELTYLSKSSFYFKKERDRDLMKDIIKERIYDIWRFDYNEKRNWDIIANFKANDVEKENGMTSRNENNLILRKYKSGKEDKIIIEIDNIEETAAREIDWIFCSPHETVIEKDELNSLSERQYWTSLDIDDVAEKIYRYFDEYVQMDSNFEIYDEEVSDGKVGRTILIDRMSFSDKVIIFFKKIALAFK